MSSRRYLVGLLCGTLLISCSSSEVSDAEFCAGFGEQLTAALVYRQGVTDDAAAVNAYTAALDSFADLLNDADRETVKTFAAETRNPPVISGDDSQNERASTQAAEMRRIGLEANERCAAYEASQ